MDKTLNEALWVGEMVFKEMHIGPETRDIGKYFVSESRTC